MFSRYDSDTQVVTVECPSCKRTSECSLKDVLLYSNSKNLGVFIQFPACPFCSALTTTYSGHLPKKLYRCHVNLVVAKAAHSMGAKTLFLGHGTKEEEVSRLTQKLDDLVGMYEDDKELVQQYLGNARCVYPKPEQV